MIGPVRAERLFMRHRTLAANLDTAFRTALRDCRPGPGPGAGRPAGWDLLGRRLRHTACLVVRALDRDAAAGELPYHNRHHTAEAVRAMGWLCAAARQAGHITALDAVVGVTAMLGHDLGHDGTLARDGRLERQAAAAVDRMAGIARVPRSRRRQLAEVIRATEPGCIGRNAARALGPLPPGRSGRRTAMLRLLANEADLFASMLPKLGWALGRALAAEGVTAGAPGAGKFATHAGRLGFLHDMPRFSPAARRLGLAAIRNRQVAAYARAAQRMGLGAYARTAAAQLDRLAGPGSPACL